MDVICARDKLLRCLLHMVQRAPYVSRRIMSSCSPSHAFRRAKRQLHNRWHLIVAFASRLRYVQCACVMCKGRMSMFSCHCDMAVSCRHISHITVSSIKHCNNVVPTSFSTIGVNLPRVVSNVVGVTTSNRSGMPSDNMRGVSWYATHVRICSNARCRNGSLHDRC